SRVQVEKANEGKVAAAFLSATLGFGEAPADGSLARRLFTSTIEHLTLVVPSLLAAVLVAVPLGVLAARRPALGRGVLAATGVLQTIPSLALLLFMIPAMMLLVGCGSGATPAVADLFMSCLVPLVM